MGGGKLNNTVCYKNQSEENIMYRARMNNDSFYSFALAANRKGHADAPSSIYDGMIHRKSYPRNNLYTDSDLESSSLYRFRNGCC